MNIIEETIVTVVNGIYESPQVQGMQFSTSSSCDKTSVINDIEFCNELEYKYSYEEKSISNSCVSACGAAKSAAYGSCDAVRKTCKTGCCGIKSCENSCDKVSSDCKHGADKAYDACVNACGYTTITGGGGFQT